MDAPKTLVHIEADFNSGANYLPKGDYVYEGKVTIDNTSYHRLLGTEDLDNMKFLLDNVELQEVNAYWSA